LIALDPNQFVRKNDGSSNGNSNGNSNAYSNVAADPGPSVDPFENYEPSDTITADAPSTPAAAVVVSPSASAPFSAPTPFNPPVNAQH
jgi:hypothetical protein